MDKRQLFFLQIILFLFFLAGLHLVGYPNNIYEFLGLEIIVLSSFILGIIVEKLNLGKKNDN